MKNSKQKASGDAELDDALEHTFPASDPVSIGGEESGEGARIDRQPAALDHDLVERLSREVKQKAQASIVK